MFGATRMLLWSSEGGECYRVGLKMFSVHVCFWNVLVWHRVYCLNFASHDVQPVLRWWVWPLLKGAAAWHLPRISKTIFNLWVTCLYRAQNQPPTRWLLMFVVFFGSLVRRWKGETWQRVKLVCERTVFVLVLCFPSQNLTRWYVSASL